MTFEKGSLILVDYTARIKDTGEVFDTTIEEDAKKHSIHDPDTRYQPKLVSVGEVAYPVLRGFDEALAGATVGEKITIEVTPDKGFGQRDPKQVRMIPIRKLGDDAEKVTVGDTIEIGDKKGIIRFIGSGRVQIDYNHRYAGKTMLFDANVTKLLDSPEDKIDGILKNRFPTTDEEIAFDVKGGEVSVIVPAAILRAEGLQIIKHFIQADVFKFAPTLEKISFVEIHANKAQKKPEEPAPLEQKAS
ncbi:MAG: peptidylprolyl isomerase [Nitrosopumilus sp. H8]|nr:MAG: peptidylprolyl isomerase [Nitrosopumilus sp. H13]RNJ77971.1 MAG: peptidylprolyl isomerase [Nitrosopumilus sp. H8]